MEGLFPFRTDDAADHPRSWQDFQLAPLRPYLITLTWLPQTYASVAERSRSSADSALHVSAMETLAGIDYVEESNRSRRKVVRTILDGFGNAKGSCLSKAARNRHLIRFALAETVQSQSPLEEVFRSHFEVIFDGVRIAQDQNQKARRRESGSDLASGRMGVRSDVWAAGALMGWSASSTVKMAKRYGHIGDSSLQKAMALLDGGQSRRCVVKP